MRRTAQHVALLLLLLSPGRSLAQSVEGEYQSPKKLLAIKIPVFDVHNESLLDAVWKLARTAPFGFGFEKPLTGRFLDPDIPSPQLNLHLEDKSAGEILTALCEADSRYAWSIEGVTVNLFSRSVLNDRTYLLNRTIEMFELEKVTDIQVGLFAIARQLPLPAEHIAHVQIGGDDPYPPEPWTATYRNLTVRQILNRLATHGGPCGTWISGGSRELYTFGFFNTHLSSKKPPPGVHKSTQPPPKGP